MSNNMTRRNLLRGAAAMSAIGLSRLATGDAPRPRTMADAGWCWDGQGLNGLWQMSIFGAGEGTKWFGLRKCCFMFHPNTALAMDKLRDMEEVVCEISKWECERVDHPQYKGLGAPARSKHDGRIERKQREAAIVSELSQKYANVAGAIDDDLYGAIKSQHITTADYAKVHLALQGANRKLKHWGVVYSHELKKDNWAGFTDFLDVITLWVWASKDLVHLDRYVADCRQLFPNSAINIGCYLRDYTLLAGVPMELLKHQWELVRRYVADGTVQGYSILAGCLIDVHPQQATWVRDFIRAN